MIKNSYFHYVNLGEHYCFLCYLLSFAIDELRNDDPLLSDCAKELIRYILGMDETEDVIITEFDGGTITVNHNKSIQFDNIYEHVFSSFPKYNSTNKKVCLVYYGNCDTIYTNKKEVSHTIDLPMKKLKKILNKYPSKNAILQHYLQYIDDQERMIQITLQMPKEQWDQYDKLNFITHLNEDAIIDMSKGRFFDLREMTLSWYFFSSNELKSMGIHNYISEICLNIDFTEIGVTCHTCTRDDEAKKNWKIL